MTSSPQLERPVGVAILGTGNIGTDLQFKLERSADLELLAVVGIDPDSDGLARARSQGVWGTAQGLEGLRTGQEELWSDIEIVFDATSAAAHVEHAPKLRKDDKVAIDLTPAAVGDFVVPSIALPELTSARGANVNLVSCGCQATAPFVAALVRANGGSLDYAEIVTTNASRSAGPGTRANLDEYVSSTSAALCEVAGAGSAKTIAILNPAEPPIAMRNTIYATVAKERRAEVEDEVMSALKQVQTYVPGCRLRVPPQFRSTREGEEFCVLTIEVRGAGDYLPAYAGNLDIMTSAAVRVGELFAQELRPSPAPEGATA